MKYSASLNKCIKYFVLCGIALCVVLLVLPLSAKAETHGKSLRNGSGCGYKWQYSYSSDQTVYVCDGPCYNYYTNYGYYKHCTSILHSNAASGNTYEQVLVYWDPCTPAYTVDPTCTEDGYSQGCLYCGLSINCSPYKRTPATGHTEETIPGKEPTCTETGLTEGKKCSSCGEIIVAQQEIPALGHVSCGYYPSDDSKHYQQCGRCSWFIDGTEGFHAYNSCVATHCSICNYERDSSAATHTPGMIESTEDMHTVYCALCHEAYLTGVHSHVNCGAACSVCGTYDSIHRPEHNMAYVTWGVNLFHYYECVNCGTREGDRIVCTAACTRPGVCTYCGGPTGPAFFHPYTFIQWDSETHWDYCQFCDTKLNVKAHKVSCGNLGVCTVCGAECSVSPDNCKNIVYTGDEARHWKVCADCGSIKEGSDGDHYVACWNNGTCGICNQTGLTPQPHDLYYITWIDSKTHKHSCRHTQCRYYEIKDHTVYCNSTVCTVCRLPADNEPIHRSEEILPGKEPTCTETGLTEGKKCTSCGETLVEQQVIPVVDHDYSGLWQPAGDHHIIPCSDGCGRRLRADCELLSAVVDGEILTVCPVCGRNNLDESFKQLPIAVIVDPEAGQPGDFLVWHILHPFGEETGVRAAFTAVYESHGQVVPPKESHLPLKIRIRLPIDDSCVLVRADDAEGKNYTEMDYTVIGDFICFDTDALGLFLIRTK